MIAFLAKIFIKNKEQYSNPSVRQAYGTLCGALGMALNVVLFAFKMIAGTISGSIAITADAFNNLSDAGSSVITLIGFRLAGKKPDPDHPFGHGRMEYITGLVVSFLIVLMGFELAKSSVSKIISPEPTVFRPIVAVILAVSIAVKLYMALYNRSIGKKIDSAAMKAVATDSLSDCIATSVVLIASLVSHFMNINIDGWCGALVSVFIMYAGINAAKDTISPLLGQPPEKEFVEDVYSIAMRHPEIQGVHDLVVHNYGPGRVMISLHAEVPADGNIMIMHDVIDNVELEISSELNCSAVIHIDPIVTNDEEALKMQEVVVSVIKCVDECITLHDFRIVPGVTHTNVIFDIVLPYDFRLTDDETCRRISELINQKNPVLRAVIQVDHSCIG